MLSIKRASPGDRLWVQLGHPLERISCQRLVTSEKSFGFSLRVAPINVRGLIPEVQYEPQLDAGIRNRQVDALPLRHGGRVLQPRVFVHIVDAPDFVECLTTASTLVALRDLLRFDSPFHELIWATAARSLVDCNEHPVAVASTPEDQILLLRSDALCQHQDLSTLLVM
ncbi:MAG TPA: hypothetical protein VFR97_13495 [Capillimicrobium sp.]|nr:hypothetical protein [Capillimicrobium sp.]